MSDTHLGSNDALCLTVVPCV